MARITQSKPTSGHLVLVVDDDPTIVTTLERILTREGHRILTATSGTGAIELCRNYRPHLILLDYFMPDLSGEAVIRAVRAFDPEVQIVLQTGYASERPARQMMAELDIQGYHDKSEGPEKLLIWVDAALKSYRQGRALRASSEGMRRILQAAPELQRLQPLDDLLAGILLQMEGLLGLGGTLIALHDGQQAEQAALEVRFGTGRFQGQTWAQLSAKEQALMLQVAENGQNSGEGLLALPLGAGERRVGVILVDQPQSHQPNLEVLQLFASQAAVAIENARLFEQSTVDELTGVATRRRWFSRLDEALNSAYRHAHTLSVVLLEVDDLDDLKASSHPAKGLLAEVSRVVSYSLRRRDWLGRLGGEMFGLLLPHVDTGGAALIAEKLRQAVEHMQIEGDLETLRITASLSVATLRFQTDQPPHGSLLEAVRGELMNVAEAALQGAKAAGGNQAALVEPLIVGALRPIVMV